MEYDNAFAGEYGTEPVKLKAGINYARFTVLGKVTATGDFGPYNSALSDGTEKPTHILI
ncbi:MAG: head decoration protein, partial [Chlamydiales bacterium]|nr:head decoration protein [Chlamydiales bacterium]